MRRYLLCIIGLIALAGSVQPVANVAPQAEAVSAEFLLFPTEAA